MLCCRTVYPTLVPLQAVCQSIESQNRSSRVLRTLGGFENTFKKQYNRVDRASQVLKVSILGSTQSMDGASIQDVLELLTGCPTNIMNRTSTSFFTSSS